jgi:hypothetical protein
LSSADQSSFTFSGWFKFDKPLENKAYPIFSIKTVKSQNADENQTTYEDLFRVSFDKKDTLEQLILTYQDNDIKTNTLQYSPKINEWFNLSITFDYKLKKGQFSYKDQTSNNSISFPLNRNFEFT